MYKVNSFVLLSVFLEKNIQPRIMNSFGTNIIWFTCHSQDIRACPSQELEQVWKLGLKEIVKFLCSPIFLEDNSRFVIWVSVRKLEHWSYFSLIFSPMDTPLPLSLTTFPLHVQPNRLYSPLLLMFVVASSLT